MLAFYSQDAHDASTEELLETKTLLQTLIEEKTAIVNTFDEEKADLQQKSDEEKAALQQEMYKEKAVLQKELNKERAAKLRLQKALKAEKEKNSQGTLNGRKKGKKQ